MSSPQRGTLQIDTTRLDALPPELAGCAPRATLVQDPSGARVRTRESRARDISVTDFHSTTRFRADTSPQNGGELRLYLVRHGAWTLRYDEDALGVPAAQFMICRADGLVGFEVAAQTDGRTVGLPADVVGGLRGHARLTGSAGLPEVRMLLAHTSLFHETLDDLSDKGVDAARNALIELARGVLHRYIDDTEPLLAPALVRAARELADQHLTDPELTPGVLARQMHISIRTLSRAFAAAGEPAAAYIRRRRLEEARRALTHGQAVSAVAARWQFADSSHFIRTFRQRYGQTPAQFARDHGVEPDRW